MPVTRSGASYVSVSASTVSPTVTASGRGCTLALRIHFKGDHGQKVLSTSKDDIQSLVPWLRDILTPLRLPHPKTTNVIKNIEASSIIEMFWDHAGVSMSSILFPALTQCEYRPGP